MGYRICPCLVRQTPVNCILQQLFVAKETRDLMSEKVRDTSRKDLVEGMGSLFRHYLSLLVAKGICKCHFKLFKIF